MFPMHLRFSSILGYEVGDEETGEVLGKVRGILVHPDTGKVEGFFVRTRGMFSVPLFLASMDIRRWGSRIHVRHHDVLVPIGEHIRLQSLLEEKRPVLGQLIRTERGKTLGHCRDLEFDTEQSILLRLYLRRFFREAPPIPASDILEVRRDAIIVRDPKRPQPAKEPTAAEVATAVIESLQEPVQAMHGREP